MDAERFDAWTKILTAGTGPRRAALRLLAGAGLSGLLALLGREEVGARRIRPGKRCEKKGKKLGKCVKGAFCNKDGYCKCRGCHIGGRCVPSCFGQCCQSIETCCVDPNGNTASCRVPDLVCGDCKDNCSGGCCGLHERCVDGLCRSGECPAPDWYVCGATCCKQGYVCCADQPFCCDPGLRCNPTGGCRK